MRMIWAWTPLTLSLACLAGCAFTIAETAGDKAVRGLSIQITASERMEQVAANRLDPLAREMLDLEQQEAILGYYSAVSENWTFEQAIQALHTARGMVLYDMDESPDEGTNEEGDE